MQVQCATHHVAQWTYGVGSARGDVERLGQPVKQSWQIVARSVQAVRCSCDGVRPRGHCVSGRERDVCRAGVLVGPRR